MVQVYLPIAEMTVPAEGIILLGGFVGFMSGLFGVGGGFLMTPFLIFMGVPAGIAVGTQANQLVSTSLSGVLGHWRRGNVDFKMASCMMIGSVTGTFVGTFIFKLLQHIGQIDIVIPVLYVLLLGGVGLSMLFESLVSEIIRRTGGAARERRKLYDHAFFRSLPYKTTFPHSRLQMSVLIPAGIGLIGGILVSIMGVGGGFLLVPMMIYILGMPITLVIGTSLLQIFVATIFATLMHAIANHTVDLVLAALLVVGGVIGAQLGLRLVKYLRGAYARIILAFLLIVVAAELAAQLFIEPAELYSTVLK